MSTKWWMLYMVYILGNDFSEHSSSYLHLDLKKELFI